MLLAGFIADYINKPAPRTIPEIKIRRYVRDVVDAEPAEVIDLDEYRETRAAACLVPGCYAPATQGRHSFCAACWRALPRDLRVDILVGRNGRFAALRDYAVQRLAR
ncbi:MAG TPA: hypothetical protein VGH28_13715 [Polyangiaceae bacterium]|jgi:hypothetical protein